ncbi:MAG: hypothetical protein AB7G17_14040 [Phycisphaerales bacterium]
MSEPCIVYECDHMRQIVLINGVWHHIHNGEPLSPCGASSIYRFEVKRPRDAHSLKNYVSHNRKP